MPGETFIYEFTPPDAGTFWYHPHMNSVKQLGMGLVGLIIVEESTPVQFDEEHALMLKHWHIDQKGQWKDLMIPDSVLVWALLVSGVVLMESMNPYIS